MAESENEHVEVDLEDSPEIELDVKEDQTESRETESRETESRETEGNDDQFKKASTKTQKRINELTYRFREAERQKQEALNFAQSAQNESQQLKKRLQDLDTNYVSEYTNRVTTQLQQAEAALADAIERGDGNETAKAQRALTDLAIQADRAAQAKAQQQAQFAAQQQAQQQAQFAAQQVRQPMPAQQPKRPDKKAEEWALKNSWFGSDEVMTQSAFIIHKNLVEKEGFDPQSDDYYTELDNRIASTFNMGATASNKRPAQTVVGVSRNSSGRSGKKVRLTPSQVKIAKNLGVPLEEYAKYVKD